MRAGLIERPIPVAELLRERLFPSRIEIPTRLMDYYRREVITPALGRHDSIAFATASQPSLGAEVSQALGAIDGTQSPRHNTQFSRYSTVLTTRRVLAI